MSFQYGFFDPIAVPNLSEISRQDIGGLVCQTQAYTTMIAQNITRSNSVTAELTEIDWSVDPTVLDEFPFQLNFTIHSIRTEEETGEEIGVDDTDSVALAIETSPDLFQYITDWVWKSEPLEESVFRDTNRVAVSLIPDRPNEWKLDRVEC